MKIQIQNESKSSASDNLEMQFEEIADNMKPGMFKAFTSWVREAAAHKTVQTLRIYAKSPFSAPFINSFVEEITMSVDDDMDIESILEAIKKEIQIPDRDANKLYKAWF